MKEDARSKGIGAKLVGFVEEMTFSSGLPNVFLVTTTVNEGAVKFYQKIGYKIIGTIPDFVKKGLDEFIFWKTKGPVSDFKIYD